MGFEEASPGTDADLGTFREVVESAGHSIYWTDINGTIEYVNPAFEAQTGYTAEEAVGNNANILQSDAHDDRFYEELWDTILMGDVWEGEIINERKHGDQYVANQTISPVTDESGEITRFVAVNEDITELKTYRKRLGRERDRFASLLDAVPVPLVLTSFDGETPIVARTNEAFDAKFGFAEQTLAGSSLDEYIVDDADSETARDVNDRILRGDSVHREVIRRTAAGETRTFLLEATPLAGEECDEALGAYIDITEQKRAEDRLRRKNEQLAEFADVISHDLRNPLSVASGHLELAAEDCESPHFETVSHAHERMDELINDVLALAKQGRAIDELEAVDLATCVSQCWETTATADAEIRIEATGSVMADENRLRQLFSNLIRNSIEHAGSEVTIAVGVLPGGFYVADDGPGIPEDERESVFESGYTTADEGTGFGLSIVREITVAHGWDVDVCESVDGGARFEITGVDVVTD
jgi:PAS domain S-box-containing protein